MSKGSWSLVTNFLNIEIISVKRSKSTTVDRDQRVADDSGAYKLNCKDGYLTLSSNMTGYQADKIIKKMYNRMRELSHML